MSDEYAGITEKLTRLQPKSQSFTDSGFSFGGMNPQDIAAAMAGIKPIGELIIRRKYINHDERGQGYQELLKHSIYRVYEADKQPKKANMIEPLLEIALDDYVGGFKCPSCKGKKEIRLDTGQVHKCRSTRCHDGRVKRKDVDRAKALGVKAIDFSRYYRPAFSVIERYLTEVLPEAENAAMMRIKKQAKWRD